MSPFGAKSSVHQGVAEIKTQLGTLSEMYAIYNSIANIAISIASLILYLFQTTGNS